VLSPQQYAAPPVVMPQVENLPALMDLNLSPPATSTGARLWKDAPPSPSWPLELSPQQNAAPAPFNAHVCRAPELI
jgi:hypothetical protein